MGRLMKYVRSCVNYFTIFKFSLYRNCVCLYWCFLYDLFWAIHFVDVWRNKAMPLLYCNQYSSQNKKSGYRCTELINVMWKSIWILPNALYFFSIMHKVFLWTSLCIENIYFLNEHSYAIYIIYYSLTRSLF